MTDASFTGGVRGSTAAGLRWDLSGAIGMQEIDRFIHNTVNASLGLTSPDRIRHRREPAAGRQRELRPVLPRRRQGPRRGRRGVARRAVPDPAGRPGGLGGRPVRAAGVHAGLERHPRLWTAAGGRLEPAQRRGLRRRRGGRPGRRVDAGRRGPHRELRELRDDGERQGVGPLPVRARQREQRVPGADPRAAERLQHPELVRPESGRSGPQRPHPVDLAAGAAARRGAARAREIEELHGRRRVRRRSLRPSRPTTSASTSPTGSASPATSSLSPAEVAEVTAGGFEAAESVRNYRFFTNAFSTTSQGIDVVSTWTPLALRGNTVVSAVFNHTDTEVTDNARGLLDGRRPRRVRLRAAPHALERRGHPARRTGELPGPPQLLQRMVRLRQRPRAGLRSRRRSGAGLLRRPPDRRPGAERSARAGNDAGHRGTERLRHLLAGVRHRETPSASGYSEYTPWGYSGAYYYVRIGYDWGL